MVEGDTGMEVHRNPVTSDELTTCAWKAVELRAEQLRLARRQGEPRATVGEVKVWVLTPTLSKALRRRFGLRAMRGWPRGCLSADRGWSVGVVVMHELPETPPTLWLRLLARGGVQERAFVELDALPESHPMRAVSIRSVLRYVAEAKQTPSPTPEQEEIVMNAQRLVDKWERDAIARGKAEGKAEAILAVLDVRGLRVPASTRKRVLSCTDPVLLEAWLRRSAVVVSTRELFVSLV